MPKLSKPRSQASNISSAANPADSSKSSTANKSSILKSSFSPSVFQLSLFASVIQGLDSQHVRIHDINTGRLRCEHALGSRASITCLDWGFYGDNLPDKRHQNATKKRKRPGQVNGDIEGDSSRNTALAFGTNASEIHFYSPTEDRILGTLREGHTHGVRDFKFVNGGGQGEAWSIGGDARLIQWDLKTNKPIRTINLPNGSASSIRPLNPSVIYASQLASIFDPGSQTPPSTFNASTNSVHTILSPPSRSSRGQVFLTAAQTDRFMNVFEEESPTLIGSLRSENEVLQTDLYSRYRELDEPELGRDLAERLTRPEEALAIVNKDGVLEIFPEPFDFGSSGAHKSAESTKEKMKRRTRRSAAQIRITRPDMSSSVIPLINAAFRDSHIVLAWTEGGLNVVFDIVKWRDEGTGTLLLKETTEIVKGKKGAMQAVVMNGVKDVGKTHVDESRAVVTNGPVANDLSVEDEQPEVIDISSGEEVSESEEEENGALFKGTKAMTMQVAIEERGDADAGTDADMDDAEPSQDVEKSPEGPSNVEPPSFGEMLRASAAEPVDVQASFVDANAQSLVPSAERSLEQLPSGMSLGTVLTQSLRTNDRNLLETCFHVKDLPTVRATIERLDSSFAATLLQRLAERLHGRPGRAGSLMVWIQWTLVAHGGYLAGHPELMKKLVSLHRVVRDRANSLQSLLSLKGKLDMLEAQMNLRKSMQTRAKFDDEENEEDVIYVEGQEDSDSEQDDDDGFDSTREDETSAAAQSHARAETIDTADVMDTGVDSDHAANLEAELPMLNGKVTDHEDEGSSSDEERLVDDEASSTDRDSTDELSDAEVDHDDVDTDSSDADASPLRKRPATVAKSDRKQ